MDKKVTKKEEKRFIYLIFVLNLKNVIRVLKNKQKSKN